VSSVFGSGIRKKFGHTKLFGLEIRLEYPRISPDSALTPPFHHPYWEKNLIYKIKL